VNLASRRLSILILISYTLLAAPFRARGQSCQTSSEMDDATRKPIAAAGQRFFDWAAKGDVASMRQSAIPSLAGSFGNAETLVKAHQADLAGGQATVKSVFLLDAAGNAPLPRAQFYCGVFGKNGQTPGSAEFDFENLPPGKYAVALLDATSPKARTNFSVILQQAGSDWKLGDIYIEPATIGGHDSDWFAARAREYKAKGQAHNAWLFMVEARTLVSPIPIMSTLATDKLYDESKGMQPADFPADGKTADLAAGGSTYKLTSVFPQTIGSDLDLVIRYQSADVSNTNKAYETNVAVMKALVTKYPELRDIFAGMVARAVDPSGRDYGTLLAMKDIK
jgi:hypothetical protein